jgi:FkbM family methyltransferase
LSIWTAAKFDHQGAELAVVQGRHSTDALKEEDPMRASEFAQKATGKIFGETVSALNRTTGQDAATAFASWTLRAAYGVLGNSGDRLVRACEARIPRSITEGRHVEVIRHGVRFTLNLDDNAQRVMYFTGWYEKQFAEWLFSELRRDDVYLDIGAHVGMHALTAARRLSDLGGGKVIAIEAAEDSAQNIRRTAKANGLSNVEVVQVGLGAHEGVLKLYADERYPPNDAGVRSKFNTGHLVCEVRLARLDDIAESIGLTRADIVKLDIEGGEGAALEGMLGALRRLEPRFVTLEMDKRRLQQAKTSAADLASLLSSSGYEPTGTIHLTNVLYKRSK